MPYRTVNGVRYFYEEKGSGTESIVFAHGFLLDHRMFIHQLEAFSDSYRCVAFDWRGQGQSQATESGYEMESLTEDAAALIRELELGPVHWVGVSMGGFVGIRLAAWHPELVRSLVLAGTSAAAEEPEKKKRWKLMAYIFRYLGSAPIQKPVTRILFGQKILSDPTRQHVIAQYQQHWRNLDRRATMKVAFSIFQRQDVRHLLPRIQQPVLVITGDQDQARSREEAEDLVNRLPNARLLVLEGAGHSSPLEEPEAFNQALAAFLKSQSN